LALSHRGEEALRAVGLCDEVLDVAVPMYGRVIHGVSGELSFQAYGKPGQHISSVSREKLLLALLDESERQPNITLHFNKKLVSCSKDGTAKFARSCDDGADVDEGSHPAAGRKEPAHETVEADLIVGADGAFSRVRASMLRGTRVNFSRQFLDHSYKELDIAPGPEAEEGLREADLEKGFRLDRPQGLHIWPRQELMLIALPNLDRSFTLTLFAPNATLEELDAHARAGRDEEVLAFFRESFPDALRAIGEANVLKQVRDNPTSSLVTVRVSPWNVGKLVLVGDAAHAVVPFFGQGMNAAFEDALMLDEALETSEWDVRRAVSAFAASRRVSTDGLADLSLENYEEMKSHTASNLFVLERAIEGIIFAVSPNWWIPRYSMVTFSRIPYHEARDRAHWQERAVASVGAVLVTAAAVAAVAAGAWWIARVQV
jgi:kynurenine 3-monooxygenase